MLQLVLSLPLTKLNQKKDTFGLVQKISILGFAVGTCTGIYVAQAYAVPNVEKTLRDYLQSLRKGPD